MTSEEEYFFRINQELLEEERLRRSRITQQEDRAERQRQHWRKCPACGNDMYAQELTAIKTLRCTDCAGVFLDQASLELLLLALRPQDARLRDPRVPP